jgi:cytochrome b561
VNRPDGFGWVSRLLHWTMAVAILFMLVLGTVIERMEPSLSSLWLFALHKSVGLTLLVLVLLRLTWHRLSPPPAPLDAGPAWQPAAARAAHLALYLLMVATPMTGWIASAATGIDVVAWGVTLPRIAPVSEAWEARLFAAHGVLTRLLMALVLVHVGAALWHARRGDGTLRRMLRGT